MTKLSAYALTFLMLAALIVPCAPALSGAAPAPTREEAVSGLLEACGRLCEMKEACSGAVTKGELGEPFNSARLIVKAAGEPDTFGALGLAEGTNGRWVIQYSSPEEAEAAAERLLSDPAVEYAVPDTEYRVSFSPCGAAAGGLEGYNSWGYGEEHVDMAALTERLLAKYGSESAVPEVIVAVCDSGVNADHGFLSGRTVPGYDFVNGDSDPSDGFGHGTFCAGVVTSADALLILRRAMGIIDSF